jgi:hypothetical protein
MLEMVVQVLEQRPDEGGMHPSLSHLALRRRLGLSRRCWPRTKAHRYHYLVPVILEKHKLLSTIALADPKYGAGQDRVALSRNV